MSQGDWVAATSIDDLPIGGRKLFRHYDKRIALFRTGRDVYAVDNRCPHQGYALLQGDVKEETLTCAWHNWKFELDQEGVASFGGEAVRCYPVEVRNGQVFVDVTDPSAEVIAPQLFESLIEAMGDVDVGRMARDTRRALRGRAGGAAGRARDVRRGANRGSAPVPSPAGPDRPGRGVRERR